MTERRKPRRATGARGLGPVATARDRRDDDVERAIGRGVALGLPAVVVVGAVAAGLAAGASSALLVVAAGALLGAIALMWASIRTLSGDAPLAADFESIAADRHGVDALVDQKRRLLRTLKDLETDHELGKIDDGDYAALLARARDEAKAVMRQLDVQVAPLRAEAERIAHEYLSRRGLEPVADGSKTGEAASSGAVEPTGAPVTGGAGMTRVADTTGGAGTTGGAVEPAARQARVACAGCGASNEADATFCKQCGARVKEDSRTET